MLVAQAKGSSERFLCSTIPDAKIDEIAAKIKQQTQNIILIGMPGCGKTTTGMALAKKTNRNFADTDDIIAKTAGKSAAEIITDDGEDAFRKQETQTLKELCKKSGQIIATGGGVVTRSENLDIMRQNGKIIYLKRALDELSTKGRPLSQQEGVEKLAAKRLPKYMKWSDCTIEACGVEKTVENIRKESFDEKNTGN